MGPGALRLTPTTKVWSEDRCYKSHMGMSAWHFWEILLFPRTYRHVKFLPNRDYRSPWVHADPRPPHRNESPRSGVWDLAEVHRMQH